MSDRMPPEVIGITCCLCPVVVCMVFFIFLVLGHLGLCPNGTFDNSYGSGGCETCPDNQYRYLTDLEIAMSEGWTSWDWACLPCFSNNVSWDHTECHSCPAGKYATGVMKIDDGCSLNRDIICPKHLENGGCDDCPSGRYQDIESDASIENVDKCMECPQGLHSISARTTCVCPAGQQGTESCTSCPDDMVSAEDQKMCHKCPPGHAPNEMQAECNSCGRHEISDGMRCKQCDKGKYPNRDHSNCVACHEGEVTISHGCQKCHHPQVPDRDRRECVTCHPPEFAQTDGCAVCTGSKMIKDNACMSCPVGTVPNHDHTECHQCHGNKVPTEDRMHCHSCPKDQIPKDDRSGCRSCEANEVPSSNCERCEECAGATVPQQSTNGRFLCEDCPLPLIPFKNQECVACGHGKIPIIDQSGCAECDHLREVVSQTGTECECKDGYARSGDSCELCFGNTVSYRKHGHQSTCVTCPPGQEPDINHAHCKNFGRTQFLIAQWSTFGPLVLGFLGLVLCIHVALKVKRPAGYIIVGEESVEAKRINKSRCWKACFCGKPEPEAWPWYILGAWDFIDWALYVIWFLLGEPASETSAAFEDDFMVSKGCSALIWFGGALPSLMWILPREAYVAIEIVYDFLELATVTYVSKVYDFKCDNNGRMSSRAQLSTVLAVANWLATGIDTLLLKGPEALDYALSVFSCCVNYSLKEATLLQDVPVGTFRIRLGIEAYLVFKQHDIILISDEYEYEIQDLLTDRIFVTTPTRSAHSAGDVVALKERDGKDYSKTQTAIAPTDGYRPMGPTTKARADSMAGNAGAAPASSAGENK